MKDCPGTLANNHDDSWQPRIQYADSKRVAQFCRSRLKRGIDLVLASILLLVLLLPLALLLLVLWIRWRASPLFTQTRIGLGGSEFTILKLRTLPPSYPSDSVKPAPEITWDISAFCAILRRFGIDEVPQLWNVIDGTMSLIGPRPELPRIAQSWVATTKTRSAVRPGITGLWQVLGDVTRPIHHQNRYDRFYVRNASLRLDLWIAARTVFVVLLGRGRHHASRTDRSWWKIGLKKKLFACTAFLVLLIVSAEVYLRIAYYEKLKTRTPPLIYQSDPLLGYRYVPNTESRICGPGLDRAVSINEHGHLGPSVPIRRPPDRFRIAVVDSSDGTGIWMERGDSYSICLQKKFDAENARVDVVNFSIDGRFRGLSQLRQIESEVLKFEPNLIFMPVSIPLPTQVFFRGMYGDYVYDYGHSRVTATELEKAKRKTIRMIDEIDSSLYARLYDLSYIFRAGCRKLMLDRVDSRFREEMEVYSTKRVLYVYTIVKRPARASIRRVAKTQRIAREKGAELILFTFGQHENLSVQLRKNGFRYLELDMPNDPRLYGKFDGHFSEEGHAMIAEKLYDYLKTEALLVQ